MRTDCVAFLLGPNLKAAFVPCQAEGDLEFEGQKFIDCCQGGWTGFHDWLREGTSGTRIMGVASWPHALRFQSRVPVNHLLGLRPSVGLEDHLNSAQLEEAPP